MLCTKCINKIKNSQKTKRIKTFVRKCRLTDFFLFMMLVELFHSIKKGWASTPNPLLYLAILKSYL